MENPIQPTDFTHVETPDFQHGYTSGLEQVDKGSYESFLSSQVHLEWLDERIAEKRQEIAQTDERIVQTRTQQKSAFDTLQAHLLLINNASKEVDRLKKDLIANEYDTATVQDRRHHTVSKYSLLAGLLYLVAGVSFLAGDLIISHEIVAYALNIRNNFEAWAFAIGLAMLSVLLKPAYERLIEAPYLESGSSRARIVYAWFKGVLVAFSIVTLFILGYFRYEAYKTDKLKESVNKTIKNLQLQQDTSLTPDPAAQTSLIEQMDKELQKIDALNQSLVTSQWALLSFVLSGILFAIAGAVCLGIAFPVLACYWYRWAQLDPRLRKLKKAKRMLTDDLNHAEETLANSIVQKHILENEMAMLTPVKDLETQRQKQKEELHKLLEDWKFAEIDSRNAAFSDGYAKGEVTRDMMSEEELTAFKSSYFTVSNLASKAKASATEKSPVYMRQRSLRPYQQIRKLITEQFDQDGDKES
ncbi:MAG: hypothetical protein U0Y10_09735 [Spirosomataceae bacterium]